MQIPGSVSQYNSVIHALQEIGKNEGLKGLYRYGLVLFYPLLCCSLVTVPRVSFLRNHCKVTVIALSCMHDLIMPWQWFLFWLSGDWLQDWLCTCLKERYSLHHMNFSRGLFLWRSHKLILKESNTNKRWKMILYHPHHSLYHHHQHHQHHQDCMVYIHEIHNLNFGVK